MLIRFELGILAAGSTLGASFFFSSKPMALISFVSSSSSDKNSTSSVLAGTETLDEAAGVDLGILCFLGIFAAGAGFFCVSVCQIKD